MSIFSTLKAATSRGMLLAQKYSPEILTGLGVAGSVASGAMLVKATLNADEVVDKAKERIDLVKEHHYMKPAEVQEKDKKEFDRNLTAMYLRAGFDFVKLYGPAITMGAASIACFISAHGIMKRRNVVLAAAYKTLETGFSEYRERVVEELGEEQERDILYNLEEVEYTNEDGKTSMVVDHKNPDDPNAISPYARFFDELSNRFDKTPEYNLTFLRAQQNYFNELLKARGHVFLNEVYDALDIERSSTGQVVGWILSKDGDNFIDFGIYSPHNERARKFVNGIEEAILLDFNVDGMIFDKLGD